MPPNPSATDKEAGSTSGIKKDNNASRSTNSRTAIPQLITRLEDDDVLMGRGALATDYEGNARLRELVRSRQKEYLQERTRKRKHEIAEEIVDTIQARGGRFLRAAETVPGIDFSRLPRFQASWIIVQSRNTLTDKVKQLLRDVRESKDTSSKGGSPHTEAAALPRSDDSSVRPVPMGALPLMAQQPSSPSLSSSQNIHPSLRTLLPPQNITSSLPNLSQFLHPTGAVIDPQYSLLALSMEIQRRGGAAQNEENSTVAPLLGSLLSQSQSQQTLGQALHQQALPRLIGSTTHNQSSDALHAILSNLLLRNISGPSAPGVTQDSSVAPLPGLTSQALHSQPHSRDEGLAQLLLRLQQQQQQPQPSPLSAQLSTWMSPAPPPAHHNQLQLPLLLHALTQGQPTSNTAAVVPFQSLIEDIRNSRNSSGEGDPMRGLEQLMLMLQQQQEQHPRPPPMG